MSIENIHPRDVATSELSKSERSTIISGANQQITMTRVASDTAVRARGWRITLHRLRRNDDKPALVETVNGAIAHYPSARYAYYAGKSLTTAIRSHPVAPFNISAFVEIDFGMKGGGQLARLVADWPYLGASITVWGTDVEVFGGIDQRDIEDEVIDGMPALSAHIAPADAPDDHNELSLCQFGINAFFPPDAPGRVYVPDFARRVRVTRANVAVDEGPSTIACQWIDDNGTVVDAFTERDDGGGPFHEVPHRATMLVFVSGFSPSDNPYCVHWRIAP